jgi:D-tyrosyl-tRNA(Tyr) deacylase
MYAPKRLLSRIRLRLIPHDMRIVLQRVSRASVVSDGVLSGSIGPGLLLLVGIETADTHDDAFRLADKVAKLRVFGDADGKMNLSVIDTGGEALVISQFTLFGDCAKGNRPSYNRAARPEHAIPLYEKFVARLSELLGKPVPTGVFGADMKVDLLNDGPVTLILDTRG